MESLNSLLQVHVDFEKSHLLFPGIIHWMLLVLFAAIVVFQGVPFIRDVAGGRKVYSFVPPDFDKLRFFGTLVLTVAYILAMEWVGSLWPNRGLGFLITSIAYVFLLALLYVHDIDRRKFAVIVANSFAAPLVAWYVLGQFFRISLP